MIKEPEDEAFEELDRAQQRKGVILGGTKYMSKQEYKEIFLLQNKQKMKEEAKKLEKLKKWIKQRKKRKKKISFKNNLIII
jgi:methylmalonyl-CoA mutase N-terminal domain/subunit